MHKLFSWRNNIVSFDILYKIKGVKNCYQIPSLKNICLNLFSKSIIADQKKIIYFLTVLKLLTNQQPLAYKSSKSISNLKLRKGMLIGSKINLHKLNATNFFWLLNQLSFLDSNTKIYNNKFFRDFACLKINNIFLFPQLNFLSDKFPLDLKFCLNININVKSNLNLTTYNKLLSLYLTSF